MRSFIFISILLLGVPAFAINGGHPLPESDKRMGAMVQVILFDEGLHKGFSCTGTMISKDFVVTAAHCLFSDLDGFIEGKTDGRFGHPEVKYFVYRGNMPPGWMKDKTITELLGHGPKWLTVKSAHFAPHFGHTEGSLFDSDLGLLQVDTRHAEVITAPVSVTMDLGEFVHMRPVSIIGGGPENDEEGATFVHIFRIIRGLMAGAPSMHHLSQRVVFENDQGELSGCTKTFIGLDHGDSGGPAFLEKNGRQYLWGVDSQGNTYTILGLHREWMNQVAARVGSRTRF